MSREAGIAAANVRRPVWMRTRGSAATLTLPEYYLELAPSTPLPALCPREMYTISPSVATSINLSL